MRVRSRNLAYDSSATSLLPERSHFAIGTRTTCTYRHSEHPLPRHSERPIVILTEQREGRIPVFRFCRCCCFCVAVAVLVVIPQGSALSFAVSVCPYLPLCQSKGQPEESVYFVLPVGLQNLSRPKPNIPCKINNIHMANNYTQLAIIKLRDKERPNGTARPSFSQNHAGPGISLY